MENNNTNLKLTGNFEIKIIGEDGVVRETISQDNNITYGFYVDNSIQYSSQVTLPILTTNNNLHISISNSTYNFAKELVTLDQIYATGAANSVLGSHYIPTYATPTNLVGILAIQERIQFTSSLYSSGGYSRTFNTIALTTNIASNTDWTQVGTSTSYTYPTSTTTANCYAYIVLSSPCTQGATEFLDITYRIQVSGNNSIVINDFIDNLLGTYSSTNPATYKDYNFYSLVNSTPISSSPYTYYSGTNTNFTNATLSTTFASIDRLTGSKKYRYTANVPSTSLRGKIVRSTFLGMQLNHTVSASNIYFNNGNNNFSTTVFQALYSHNSNANTPYYDINTLVSGSIRPTLSGNWNFNIPDIYWIYTQTSGGIGTSTYKYAKRKTLGTNGIAWADDINLISPYVHSDNSSYNQLYSGYPSQVTNTSSNVEIQRARFSNEQIVQADNVKVALINIFTGAYTLWNSTTTPALPTTAIRQICVFSTVIYIACRNTGLWAIDTIANTVTNVNSTPCLSVDISGINKVIAIFYDGTNIKLSTSDSSFVTYASNFTFPLTNLYNSNINNFYFHKCDQNTAATSNRIGIVVTPDNASNVHIYWWDSSTGILTTGNIFGYSSIGLTSYAANPASLLSFSNGAWLYNYGVPYPNYNCYTIFFNAAVSSAFNLYAGGIPINNNSVVWINGNIYLLSTNSSSPTPTIIQSSLITNILPSVSNSTPIYLGSGICLIGNNIFIPFNNFISSTGASVSANTTGRILNPYLWDSYYWDTGSSTWILEKATWSGTAWVQPNGAGKPSHSDTEALNPYVSITFTETGSSGLIATDYYTQILCNGVSLDSITNNFQFQYEWNYLPQVTSTFGSGVTIPSSSPYTLLTPSSVYNSGSSSDSSWGWLETEDLTLHNINISGYSVPATLYNNTNYSPGVNEVVINGSNGNLIFNSADAGKSISSTSTYTYNNGHNININFTVPTPFAGVHRPVCLLRSDLGLTSSSGSISAWADQSGYGNNAVKSSGTLPTTGTLGSINTVNFATNTSWLNLPNISYFADGFSVFTYIKFTTASTNKIFFRSNNSGSPQQGDFQFFIDTNGYVNALLRTSNPANNYVQFINSTPLSINTWYLISISNNPDYNYTTASNGMIIRINQVNSTFTITNPTTTFLPYKQVGNINTLGGDSGSSSSSFIGQMVFFSFYKNYLTLPEIQTVESGILSLLV